jgi:ABC-2 type transport system permease protein
MYLHELKSMRKTTLIWTCAIIGIAALYLTLYPGIVSDAAAFKKMLEGYPPAFRTAIGLSVDAITSMLSFYSFAFIYVTLCGAIQAMNLGVSVLTKETRGHTCDFLLVKPVSRNAVLSAKVAAALTCFLFTNVFYTAAAYIIASSIKTAYFSGRLFLMINATLLFIQIIFFAVGLFISVLAPRLKSVLPVSLGTVFGLYFGGMLLAKDQNSPLRFFSPFRYFNTAYIIKNNAYENVFLIAGAAVVIIATAASYFIYNRRDIQAVS